MAKFPTFPLLLDEVKRFSLADLKQRKLLDKGGITVITWTRGDTVSGSICVIVNIKCESPYIKLLYSFNEKPVDYRVPLIKVPSNLGKGFVWYFQCPVTKKRCRVLYSIGSYFLHREAAEGAMYECQT